MSSHSLLLQVAELIEAREARAGEVVEALAIPEDERLELRDSKQLDCLMRRLKQEFGQLAAQVRKMAAAASEDITVLERGPRG